MKLNNIYKLIISIVASNLAGLIGAVFSVSAVSTWYLTLSKPGLNPPSWIFGPVWTSLYFLMGISVYLIWKKGFKKKGIKNAMEVFLLQLILNATWSVVFFGLENPGLALINIILLWASIAWTMIVFYKKSHVAAYLLVPYLAWVSFATYLNYSIWILN